MSTLPLHNMIKTLIDGAKEKVAADQNDPKVKKLLKFEKKEHGHIPSVEEEKAEYGEKTAAADFTNPEFVEKLASAVDYLSEHLDEIEPPGPVAQAVSKVTKPAATAAAPAILQEGEEGAEAEKVANTVGAGPGALPVSKSIGGTQKYKKDKPKTEDAAASQASTPLSTGDNGKGKTQLENNMHKAPGQSSGSVPRAKYPDKGPLVNNSKAKTASATTPAEEAKALVLEKLAGEDVFKANISAKPSADPHAGKGQLRSFDANTPPPKASGGPTEGFGNQGRKHIASITSAINYTKKDAKGPVKSQLKEVLDEPALTRKTDSKVHENLRNADKGGVKIAQVRSRFAKVAAAGCTCGGKGECTFDLLKEAAGRAQGKGKVANAMMGYGGGAGEGGAGMMSMAGTADPAMGGAPGAAPMNPAENERVRRLKLLLAQARQAAPAPGVGMAPADAMTAPVTGAPAAGAGVVPGPAGA